MIMACCEFKQNRFWMNLEKLKCFAPGSPRLGNSLQYQCFCPHAWQGLINSVAPLLTWTYMEKGFFVQSHMADQYVCLATALLPSSIHIAYLHGWILWTWVSAFADRTQKSHNHLYLWYFSKYDEGALSSSAVRSRPQQYISVSFRIHMFQWRPSWRQNVHVSSLHTLLIRLILQGTAVDSILT